MQAIDSFVLGDLGPVAADLDIRRFFRKAPKPWLQQYFARHGALKDFDWVSLKVRNIEPLHQAWLRLDPEFQSASAADFQDLLLLGTVNGKVAIIDEGTFHPKIEGVAQRLSQLEDPLACAFCTYLEWPKLWDGALAFAVADGAHKRYWRTRTNLPRLSREPTENDAQNLGAALTSLLTTYEGRGQFCEVQLYRRRHLEYYFAYPQDHRQTSQEYDKNGRWRKRAHNPSFDIIFIHDDARQTLKVWHEGNTDRVKDLQVAFAKAVLDADIQRDSLKDTKIYDLENFMNPDFALSARPELGIKSTELRKIRIQVLGANKHTFRVDLGSDCQPHVIFDRVADATRNIPSSLLRVSQVGIKAVFELRPGETDHRYRNFEITWPNTSSLQDEDDDLILQQLLEDNGIEPKEEPKEPVNGDQS